MGSGKEVVYCFNCGVRLLRADFERGTAFRVKSECACNDCLPDLLALLPPKEREAFKKGQSEPEVKTSAPRRGTGRVPMADKPTRKITSTRIRTRTEPEEEEEGPPRRKPAKGKSKLPLVLVGAGILVAVLVAILATRKKPGGGAGEEDLVKSGRTSALKTAPPVEGPKTPEDLARAALQRARDFQAKNPADYEAQAAEFMEVALKHDKTAAAEEAGKEVKALRDKIAKGMTPEMEKLLGETKEPREYEEYKKVLDHLDKAKDQNAKPAWILQVDKQIDEVKGEAEKKFGEVKQKAEEAKGKGETEEVKKLRERVAKWGIERLLEEYDKTFGTSGTAKTEAPKDPSEPARPAGPVRNEEGKAYLDKWMTAVAPATNRDYASAIGRVDQASKGRKEASWKREAADDLKDLRAVEALAKAALKAMTQVPPGTKVSLELFGAAGTRETVAGTVLAGDVEHLEVQREGQKDVAFVDPAELTAPSLVQAAQRSGRPKPADLRAAAVLLLLEGEAEEAKKTGVGGIPEKYWDYAKDARDRLPKLDGAEFRKEREAKILFWGAARDYSRMETFGGAIEKYRTLARDYVGTPVVSRNIKLVTVRSEAGKEYFLLTGDLRGSGAVKLQSHQELESCWTCQEDVTDPARGRETYVEIEFWALPETAYQCWVFAGACCLEKFMLYLQATEMTGPSPKKASEKGSYEGGGGVAAPLEPKVRGLKRLHSQHAADKETSKWDWIPIPLPKYASPGLKKVRLMTEQKGFSVAMALVTSARKAPPKEEELGEERRRAAEEAAGRRRAEAGLVGLWTFDEQQGNAVEDRSGRGNKGTLQGGPQWAKNVSPDIASGNNGSIKLDSKDDFMQVAHSASLELDTASFTVSAWVCLTDEEPARLVNKWDGKVGWVVDLNSDAGGKKAKGKIRVKLNDGKEDVELVVPAALDTKGKRWSHVAVVVDRDAKEVRVHVNGASAGTKGLGELKGIRNASALGVGCIPSNKGNQLGGFIDEVRLYARAFSSAEVGELVRRAAGR